MLHKLMKTFSYATEAEDKFKVLTKDIEHLRTIIREYQKEGREYICLFQELRKDLDDLRNFVVNDPDSPYIIKLPGKRGRPKSKK